MSETVEKESSSFHVVPNRAEKRRRLRQWGEPRPGRSRRQRVKHRIERKKNK